MRQGRRKGGRGWVGGVRSGLVVEKMKEEGWRLKVSSLTQDFVELRPNLRLARLIYLPSFLASHIGKLNCT